MEMLNRSVNSTVSSLVLCDSGPDQVASISFQWQIILVRKLNDYQPVTFTPKLLCVKCYK